MYKVILRVKLNSLPRGKLILFVEAVNQFRLKLLDSRNALKPLETTLLMTPPSFVLEETKKALVL